VEKLILPQPTPEDVALKALPPPLPIYQIAKIRKVSTFNFESAMKE
jgi:hypothetical protein